MTKLRRLVCLMVAAIVPLVVASEGLSQILTNPVDPPFRFPGLSPTPQGDRFATVLAPAPTRVYRLELDAHYHSGCFAPCHCAVADIDADLDGTMELTRTASIEPNSVRYNVTNVNFKTSTFGKEQFVRGSGTYTWYPTLGALTVLSHRLVLDLRVGEGEVQRYDSGIIAGAAAGAYPAINIVIDVNDQVCFDTVLTISATPVPNGELQQYIMTSDASWFEGCLEPCRCAVAYYGLLRGTFTVVPLPVHPSPTTPPRVDYAVIRINWRVRQPYAGAIVPLGRITGTGFYTLIPSVEGDFQHSMRLAITKPGTEEQIFRSGEVPLPPPPRLGRPRINIDIGKNNFDCYDEIFQIRSLR